MTDAAPLPAPYGTPIRGLDFGEVQFRSRIGNGLTLSSGVSTAVAHLVADETGDLIRWPFHTIGFVDDVPRTLVVLIHCGAGVPQEAELSVSHCELPLTRAILRTLAERLFVDAGQRSVMVRVRPDDEALQRVILRLGFRASGRDDAPEPLARLLFTLDAATGLRRAFPRGLCAPERIC